MNISNFDINKLFKQDQEYFHYHGTYTVPVPHNPKVSWFIFPEPLPIKKGLFDRIDELSEIRDETNYKPTHPLDCRKLVRNFK
mmetsp:Transcript_18843/g.13665  ORF Transcript_18843/g.13665 Transcript_18843/m.13665 type:complete len:83 (+) Transcript_18843:517-765(+)